MRSDIRRGTCLVLLALTLLVGTTGCTTADALELAGLFAGEVLAYKAWGSSGNAIIDALLEAERVLHNYDQAEDLMREGRQKRDLKLMDQAIEKRPGDWRYRVESGALALLQGDVGDSDERFVTGWELVPPGQMDDYLDRSIEELERVRNYYSGYEWESGDQCRSLYSRLAINYEQRALNAGTPLPPQVADYQYLEGDCPE
jgi:hypothetical protein